MFAMGVAQGDICMPGNNDIERALQRAREGARISEADRTEAQEAAVRAATASEQRRVGRIRQAGASFLRAMVDADTPGIELLYQRKRVIWSDKPGSKEVAGWTVASDNEDKWPLPTDKLFLLANGVFLRANADEKQHGGVVHTLGESPNYTKLENQIPANLGAIATKYGVNWAPTGERG